MYSAVLIRGFLVEGFIYQSSRVLEYETFLIKTPSSENKLRRINFPPLKRKYSRCFCETLMRIWFTLFFSFSIERSFFLKSSANKKFYLKSFPRLQKKIFLEIEKFQQYVLEVVGRIKKISSIISRWSR